MGRFLTEAELRDIYGTAVVTSLAASVGSTGFVERSIEDAEDEALGYLRGHTDIPATPETTSRRLKVLVGQLAYYNLHHGKAATPFRARDGRDIAVAGLKGIQRGELSIASPADLTASIARPAVSVIKRDPRDESRITLESMRDWGH
jgi:hypothetical protein